MSWMLKLYETYENCADIVGLKTPESKGLLLPIGHTLLSAHITVALDRNGSLLDAAVVDENNAETVSPCTEDSGSRSGTDPLPHPLFDKMQYLAGDYSRWVDTKAKKKDPHALYMENLRDWCHSVHGHPKVCAIYEYLQKGTLVVDLIDKQVLHTDSAGKIMNKWTGDKDAAPPIFLLKNVVPENAVVRFSVRIPGDPEDRVWMDKGVRDSFIAYIQCKQQINRLCYVTGKEIPYIKKHPKKIINTLANAKLISGNDTSGLTFRGRFDRSDQAVSIGYNTSQKAHNALRWIVDNRSFRNDEQVIIAWGTGGETVPIPIADSDDIFGEAVHILTDNFLILRAESQTQRDYARRLNAALLGARYDRLEEHGEVVVMVLDSATVGRLAITYYRVMPSGDYLERLAHWHETCQWLHSYKKDTEKKPLTFIGAPSSKDIASAAYGPNVSGKLRKATIQRLLPCIFDGARVPQDLVNAAIHRASNPMAAEYWEWNKTLSIACALYRKSQEKEAFAMALEKGRTDRDYLYGRLLAVADWVERMTFDRETDRGRATNAMRYMNGFSRQPFRTWQLIEERLKPYEIKLGPRGSKYKNLISQIMHLFLAEKYEDNSPLNGTYLLGYHCQRQVFIDAAKEAAQKRDTDKLNEFAQDEVIDEWNGWRENK